MRKAKKPRGKPPRKIKKRRRALNKPTAKQLGALAMDQLYCLVGNCCNAAALMLFAVPNHVAQSGVSGIAVMLNYFFPRVPIGLANLALNAPIVVLALIFLGWRLVSKTLIVLVEFSLVVDLLPRFVAFTYTDDRLLATVVAGVLYGFGSALILMRGATSGGTEVIGRLIRKRRPDLPFGRVLMAINYAIVLGGAFAFRDPNAVLYAAVMLFLYSRVVDAMLYGVNNGKVFYIFSDKAEEIARAVIEQISRGATILKGKGAVTGEEREMLLCVVHRGEVAPLRRLIKEYDPGSFMVVAEAQEVFGEGFGKHE
ncbi:MAG: YitT family protein [Oscillospiraceae bacterium]|nr:YitT family protein [Oscillospiraceae bacterium]